MSDVTDLFDEQTERQDQTIRRLKRQLADEKDRTEAISKAVNQAIYDGIAGLELPDFTPASKDKRQGSAETAVLLLSDWQLGKRTETYDSAVCEERIKLYCEKVQSIVELQRAHHPVKHAAIFLLGDMVEGELIFPGQEHEIDASLFDQVTVTGPRILEGVIAWAAEFFETVTVYAVPGNHGYLGGRARKNMHPLSNADRMLYRICQMLTERYLPNVEWHVSQDWYQIADLGPRSRFFLCHGDNVRGYSGIPWYGWQRAVQGLSMMNKIWGIEFDYLAAGHFHTPVSIYINGIRYWINASTESHNAYALKQLNAAGEPAQWLLFSKPGFGTTAEYLVGLS